MPDQATDAGLIVREATSADNDAIISLELNTPLMIGDIAETFDRSPDAFACCRLHERCHTAVAELDGRLVGLMSGVMIAPVVQGRQRRVEYIHRARVDPSARHKRVAWSLSNYLFAWAGEYGSEGPCYMIAAENSPSIAFVERGGGRWPVDMVTLHIDTARARATSGKRLTDKHLPRAIELINATHAAEDFFEPLSLESLGARLNRHAQYGLGNLHGAFDGERLVAVAGLLDRGAYTERIDTNIRTGETVRSRRAVVVDWGFDAGCEPQFSQLLEVLAAEAREMGRGELSICEPFPGAIPLQMPYKRTAISLFTPSIAPPDTESVRGLYFDPLNL